MKTLFGVVSLLVVLAAVGLVAARQLRTALPVPAVPADSAAPGMAAVPSLAASASVRQQAQQLQQRVGDDVARALEQGAAARREAAEQ